LPLSYIKGYLTCLDVTWQQRCGPS